MKKKILLFSFLSFNIFSVAMAGGYLTNTNQSVAFLRNPARDAAIGIDGAYSNPAGIGFMGKGWHFAFNIQSAYQTRDVYSNFAGTPSPFINGTVNGKPSSSDGVRHFPGKANAPIFPSIDLARVYDNFFFSLHLGITGGGGKCTYKEGLGLFESQCALVPAIINSVMEPTEVAAGYVCTGYSADSYMRGRQYYWGAQFNAGYKVTQNFNVSAGFRVVYADCNYYGYVRNISAIINTPDGSQVIPVHDYLLQLRGMPTLATLGADRELNCNQNGFGITPIIGLDWKLGKWNLAAKWEWKTRLRLKNETGANTSGLDEYDDEKKNPADLPTILTAGVQYEALDNLRLNAGFHYYVDKNATQYEHREKLLKDNGFEVLAGVEWDVCDWATASFGGQITNYGLGKNSQYLTNISFVTNSFSLGGGARFKVSDKVSLDVAYFKTIYNGYKKDMDDYNDLKQNMTGMITTMAASGALNAKELAAVQNIGNNLGSYSTAGRDRFERTNDVFGIAVNVDF